MSNEVNLYVRLASALAHRAKTLSKQPDALREPNSSPAQANKAFEEILAIFRNASAAKDPTPPPVNEPSPKKAEPIPPKTEPTPPYKSDRFSDALPDVGSQDFLFGPRSTEPIANGPILYERCGYTREYTRLSVTCYTYHDKNTKKVIGTVPRISLQLVWIKAQRWLNAHPAEREGIDITEEEWESARRTLSRYLKRTLDSPAVTVQEALDIPVLTYEELFIRKATQVIVLLKAAISYEIQEIKMLERNWAHIKKYRHRVLLQSAFGGIFNDEECRILYDLKIKNLNALRKQDIYLLKHFLQGRDFINFIKEVNAAFKEDFEKRKDSRFKYTPILLTLLSLSYIAYLSYTHKYTLIKDATAFTPLINLAALVWVFAILIGIYGAMRAVRRRRKKVPNYYYFTKKMRRTTVFFALCALVIIGSTIIFYHRYDGYDYIYYYSDEPDGSVCIAGLRQPNIPLYNIPDQMDGKPVSRIGIGAFARSDATEVNIPATVTKIDRYAFSECELLNSIQQAPTEYGTAITVIGNEAFKNCHNLHTANLFPMLRVVGSGAFRNCAMLTDPYFTVIEEIGARAFFGCQNIQVISIPSSIQRIGEGCFDGCTSVSAISLPFIGPSREDAHSKSLDYVIDHNTLGDFTLFSVTLTEVDMIHAGAFKNCEAVLAINLQSAIHTIEAGAFDGAIKLQSFYIPDTLASLPDRLFKDCSLLAQVQGGASIAEIGEETFANCYTLNTLSLPNLAVIHNKAFVNCSGLSYVSMPNLQSIGDRAFEGCASLASISFPSLTTLGEMSFFGCHALSSVSLPNLTALHAETFADCTRLGIISMDSLTSIEKEAFAGCYALSSVSFPNLQTIGEKAFYDCASLTSFTLPDSVTEIPNEAFSGCSALSTFTFNSSLVTLGKEVFLNCKSLRELSMPDTVTQIGTSLAEGCISLETLKLSTSLGSIPEDAFRDCDSLHLADIPGSVKVIEKNAFYNCEGLSTIKLSDGIAQIEDSAFEGCSQLPVASVPATVTEMGKDIFKNCDSLHTLTVPFVGKTASSARTISYITDNDNLINVTVTNANKIAWFAFAFCDSLVTLTLNDGITSVGKNVVFGSKALQEINLPRSLSAFAESFSEGKISYID